MKEGRERGEWEKEKKKERLTRYGYNTPLIAANGRLRQGDCYKFGASLSHISSSR